MRAVGIQAGWALSMGLVVLRLSAPACVIAWSSGAFDGSPPSPAIRFESYPEEG